MRLLRWKRNILVWAAAGLSVTSALLVGVAQPAGAVRADWTGKSVQVVSQASASAAWLGDLSSCPGGTVQRVHNSSDDRNYTACVFGDIGQVRIARYFGQTGYLYAVSFATDSAFYKIRGLCDSGVACEYAPGTDLLTTPYYIDQANRGLAVYKNVSHALFRTHNDIPAYTYFQFQPEQEPWVASDGARPVAVNARAFSKNGQWLVAEMNPYGIVLINTATYQVRRVVASIGQYGHGLDPRYELAVSNGGDRVAMAGVGVGLDVYDVSPLCGDDLSPGMNASFNSYVTPCQRADVDPGRLFPGSRGSSFPLFTEDASRLTLMVQGMDGLYTQAVIGPVTGSLATVDYMALGDSYTSGEGATDDGQYIVGTLAAPNACHVSMLSYPFLVGQHWQVNTKNMACSGAVAQDIVGRSSYTGQGNRLGGDIESVRLVQSAALDQFTQGLARQGDFVLRYQPRVLTLSIGGNDAGLMGKLQVCLGLDTCEWAQKPDLRQSTATEIATLYDKVRATLTQLKAASPGSALAMVGYPDSVSQAARCKGLVGTLLNQTERVFIHEAIHYMNTVLAAAAQSQGVRFVDIETALAGNRLCDDGRSAMNGIRYGDDIAPLSGFPLLKVVGAESFHPTPLGHELIAQKILSQVPAAEVVNKGIETTETPVPEPDSFWQATSSGATSEIARRQILQLVDSTLCRPLDVISVTVPTGVFEPNSMIQVELHSADQVLGTATAGSDGSVQKEVTIPASAVEGYHTLHLYGTDVLGEPVDVYRFMAVDDPKNDDQLGALAGSASTSGPASASVSTPTSASGSSTAVSRGGQSESVGVRVALNGISPGPMLGGQVAASTQAAVNKSLPAVLGSSSSGSSPPVDTGTTKADRQGWSVGAAAFAIVAVAVAVAAALLICGALICWVCRPSIGKSESTKV